MSVARNLKVVTADKRRDALDNLSAALEIGRIEKITQRGRDVATAPFTLHMADADQTEVRVGPIKSLRSQPALGDVLSVRLKRMPPPIDKTLWHDLIAGIINDAVEVLDVGDESYSALVREWLTRYVERATHDKDSACAHEAPFIAEDHQGLPDVYVHIDGFITDLDRHHSIKATHTEIRGALLDLGFSRRTINYTKGGKSSTRSYWTAPMDALDPKDGLIG